MRGKPVGVTGGDRLERTVLGAASIEAKKMGVKTGMQIWQAKKICPDLVLVKGDSDKYLETTRRFLSILKDYSPFLEVFSIDEAFLEVSGDPVAIAFEIKQRIYCEIGEWITCSIGISYNKLMAKLAGSLYKPDGLAIIEDEQAAQFILDQLELAKICGIGRMIKKRLNNMGIFNFKQLRQAPLEVLLTMFKSYGQTLYNMTRGIDNSPLTTFYEKGEVKSIGHRHTLNYDTSNQEEIKQILLKLTELVARRLRAKKLAGKTIHCWYRETSFEANGMQVTIPYTNDGPEIFKAAWNIFQILWNSPSTHSVNTQGLIEWNQDTTRYNRPRPMVRMIGVSISNLKPAIPQNISLLAEVTRQEAIIQTLDKINDKYGEFTLQRGILLTSAKIQRKPNPFLSDRRFKL